MTIETKTKEEFEAFLKLSTPGEQAIYHVGFLVTDAMTKLTLRQLQAAVLMASDMGQAMLTQRKLADRVYEYRATRK